jgi:hypothetical protein
VARSRTAVRVLPVLLAVVGVVALGGCDDKGVTKAAKGVGTVQSVDCPDKAKAVAVPPEVTVPLPQGTVLVDVRHGSEHRTVVTGVVPAAEKDVLADLQQAYAAAGLTLSEGETEEHDAESNFTGGGTKGRWGIRELTDCSPVATRIDMVVSPAA